jgi:hypothetical protein
MGRDIKGHSVTEYMMAVGMERTITALSEGQGSEMPAMGMEPKVLHMEGKGELVANVLSIVVA